jgi:hypothetical protein
MPNGMPQQAPQQLVVSPSFNDNQVIALVAAHLHNGSRTPAESVALAMELVAETVVQWPNMNALIRQKKQALET